jgi:hypothetical protein
MVVLMRFPCDRNDAKVDSVEDRPPWRAPSNRQVTAAMQQPAFFRCGRRQSAAGAAPIAVRTSNSSGKNLNSSACYRKPTPLEPPVPRLKPMMRITVRM